MSQTITQGRLRIDANFKRFVDEEVLPGTGLDAAAFWRNFDEIVHDLAPENRQLLAERDRIQAALDEWHRSNPGPVKDKAAYKSFLRELGYLVPQLERVTVETTGIDSEITSQAGPQLVVPAMNARYALNAANARWGSLYDALYGSDIIPQEGAMVMATIRNAVSRLSPGFGVSSMNLYRWKTAAIRMWWRLRWSINNYASS